MVIYEAVDKRFLNQYPNEGGSVCWSVQLHQGRESGRTNVDSHLDITDCYKKISLEFFAQTPAKYKDRIDKIDCLIGSLENFRAALFESRYQSARAIVDYRNKNKGKRFKKEKDESPD